MRHGGLRRIPLFSVLLRVLVVCKCLGSLIPVHVGGMFLQKGGVSVSRDF